MGIHHRLGAISGPHSIERQIARARSMALPQEKHLMLPEPLHSRALQYSLSNLNRELARQSTDDPEFIDRELLPLPLLYCLHIEHYENQSDDFNIHHLRGWRYSEMIIALAEKDSSLLYKAWQHLMQTRFEVLEAGSASSSKFELVDLTTPEPRRDEGSSIISRPPIIDLVTPDPIPVVDLSRTRSARGPSCRSQYP
jgi:hypothetical protein